MNRKDLASAGILIVLSLVLAVALVAPLTQLVVVSLKDDAGRFTFGNYLVVLTDSYYLGSLAGTIAFCAITSVLAVALALPAAWRIGMRGPGGTTLRVFCQLNYAFGSIIYGMLMLVLLGNVGIVPMAEEMIFSTETSRVFVYTTYGLAIAYFGFQVPRAALVIAQAVEKIDPNLLRAARTLGADGMQQATMVIIPTLRPALVAALILTFLISIGSFGVALLVAKQISIYPVIIFKEFTGFANFGTSAAMTVILCLVVIAAFALLRRIYPSLELLPTQSK